MSCNFILNCYKGTDYSPEAFMRVLLLPLILSLLAPLASVAQAEEVNIYSHRQRVLLEPLLADFTAKTGIKTNVVFAAKGLAQRLEAEGPASPADMVLTVDIARLAEYAERDLFQTVESDVLNNAIPAHLRSADNSWFGLSRRTRLIVTHKDRVAEGAITRIEDLADPKFEGRICTRKGSHVYNRALLASLIAHHGEAEAEAWARGLVANLARKPQGNDRAQAKAIFAGECDIAILNHYYFGKMVNNDKEPEQKDWAAALRVVLPNQSDRGAHINISGGGVTKYAPNRDNAVALLEYLVSAEAQALYAAVNYEYPIGGDTASGLGQLGALKADTLPIEALATHAAKAQMIIDRVGW
jgi:iron(III) transport system substrate-binding protein